MKYFSFNRAVADGAASWCMYWSLLFVLFCQIEIRCTKVGEWTAEFSMCSKLQGLCSPPPNLNSVEYSCDHGRDVGEWRPRDEASDFLKIRCWLYFPLPVKWNKTIDSCLSGPWLICFSPTRQCRPKLLWDSNCMFCAQGQMAGPQIRCAFKSILKTSSAFH